MADDLNSGISALDQLIKLLTEARDALDSTSNSWKNLNNIISSLSTSLTDLAKAQSALANAPGKLISVGNIQDVEKFTQAVQKAIKAVEEGSSKLQSIPGIKGGFNPLAVQQARGEATRAEAGFVNIPGDEAALELDKITVATNELRRRLEELRIAPEAIDKIIASVKKLGVEFEDVKGRINLSDPVKGIQNLSFSMETASGSSQKFKAKIDETTRSLVELQQTAQKPAVATFAETLQAAGVPRAARKQLVEETFGGGLGFKVDDTSAVRIKKLEDGVIQLTTTLKVGEKGVVSYSRTINQLGQVLDTIPQKIEAAGAAGFQQVFGATPEVGDRVAATVKKYGFELDQLNRITTEASTGIRTLNFAVKDGEGVYRNLTMHVDRFGNVLHDSSRRFRDFGSAIVRNISESFRWAVAITAVYLPLRKLQEGIGIAIENEAKLASIGVVLGRSHRELSDAFDAAAQAAKITGESINGVLDGYTQAFRATGNIRDESERAATAQQLLIDSLILSKLSSLDQANAMDTLVGALRQAGLALDEGQQLLDSWVAVTRKANVDLTTLAESFAITSTSAENAGVSFDQLNGIIATVAETTTLSATEAGNAVRAFISGFQTQKARDELAKFGVSVEDINGNVRDFMDVMREISQLRTLGLIDSAQLNKIGEALGGGARRGAQYVAFIENLSRVQEVAEVSANAQGEAMDALGITMDTVQTSVTQLGNAFQELAQAVGQEGGVLGGLKVLLDILTQITEAATTLSKLLGPTGPLVAGGGALLAYLGTRGRLPGIQQGIAQRITGTSQMITPAETELVGVQMGNAISKSFQSRLAANIPLIGTLLGEAVIAGINIHEGDFEGLGGQIAGGIVGGIIGGPIGIIIGSTAGEAFIKFITERKGDFESLITPITPGAQLPGAQPVQKTPAELLAERQEKLVNQIIQEAGGSASANIQKIGLQLEDALRKAFGKESRVDVSKLDTVNTALTTMKSRLAGLERPGAQELNLGLDIEAEKERLRTLIEEIENLKKEQEDLAKGVTPSQTPTTPFGEEVLRVTEQYGDVLKNDIIANQKELFQQLSEGTITSKEYNQSLQNLSYNGLAVSRIFAAANDVLGDTEESFRTVTEVVASSSQDQIDQLNLLANQVAEYQKDLQDIEKIKIVNEDNLDEIEELGIATKDTEGNLKSFSDILTEIQNKKIEIGTNLPQVQEQLARTIEGLYELQQAAQLELPRVTRLDVAEEDFQAVVDRASQIDTTIIEEAIAKGFLPSDTTVEEVKSTWETLFIEIAGNVFKALGNVQAASLQQAAKQLEAEGKITLRPETGSPFQVKTVDMTQQAFLSAYQKQLEFLQQAFGPSGWKPDLQTMGLIFKDGTDVLHLDNLAMQLAMQELIDVNRKQLEGVFNLPTDSSFFVPFQGYRLGFDEGGGGLGGAATALNEAADALKDAASDLTVGPPRQTIEEFFGLERPIGPEKSALDQIAEFFRTKLPGPFREDTQQRFESEQRAKDRTIDEENLKRIQDVFARQQQEPQLPIEFPDVNIFNQLIEAIVNLTIALKPQPGQKDILGIQVPEPKPESEQTFLDRLLQLMPAIQAPQVPTIGATTGTSVLDNLNSILSILQQKVQTLSGFSTNLKIESRSTTTLVVDGRTLAQVIKPYLYSDLIRFEDTSNNITRTIVT